MTWLSVLPLLTVGAVEREGTAVDGPAVVGAKVDRKVVGAAVADDPLAADEIAGNAEAEAATGWTLCCVTPTVKPGPFTEFTRFCTFAARSEVGVAFKADWMAVALAPGGVSIV